MTLVATISPNDAENKTVIWGTSNLSIASVVDGKVTALKAGKATITVKTDDGGKTAICEVTVNAKVYPVTGVILDKSSATLTEGDELALTATVNPDNATNKNVTWTSSNSSVASVSNGKVTALKAGKATITVRTDDGGKTATCEVTVNAKVYPVTGVTLDKTSASLTEGDELTLTAIVTPDNATNKNVTWSSSNPSVASVSNGKVTALKAGKTTITVKTEDGGKTATCEVTVNAKVYPVTGVTLDKSSVTLTEGDELTLTATINPDNATNKNVTWLSSNSSVASVSNGKVTALKAGKATITVKTEDGGMTDACEIIVVEPPKVESLSIKFYNTSGTVGGCLYIGEYYDFSVTSEPSNAVANYEWKVEDEKIATISGNGNTARIYTKDYGKTNVVVNDLRSGISKSYEIGTAVTDFMFTEDTGETNYGYPMITLVIGETHQLQCSYNPSYATGVFRGLRSFNVKEVNAALNSYVIVDKPTTVDIDENGLLTAKNVGTTILANNSGGYVTAKSSGSGSKGVFIKVISEYVESEYNDEMSYADVIKEGNKMKFRISTSSDIDVFRFTSPANLNGYFDIKLTYEGDLGTPTGVDKHLRWELYNADLVPFGSGDLSFKSEGSATSPSQVWLNTRQGYVRFYIKDYWKSYPSAIPSGYFTVEFIPR